MNVDKGGNGTRIHPGYELCVFTSYSVFAESGKSKVLFVKNLSYSTDKNSLKAAFEGAVDARVATFPDNPTKSKGWETYSISLKISI